MVTVLPQVAELFVRSNKLLCTSRAGEALHSVFAKSPNFVTVDVRSRGLASVSPWEPAWRPSRLLSQRRPPGKRYAYPRPPREARRPRPAGKRPAYPQLQVLSLACRCPQPRRSYEVVGAKAAATTGPARASKVATEDEDDGSHPTPRTSMPLEYFAAPVFHAW